ncbi:MAG: hypothetical protein ACE5H2_06350 [Terriglobia bacterium]
MIFGFNTDVPVGKTVFHVQTEDRGSTHPVIDTTIYVGGRVLAKRATSYRDFLASPDFSESELHAMLERQHHQFIEEIRTGQLPEIAEMAAEERSAISVQLLNAGTFMVGTTAMLRVGVTQRGTEKPVPATVRAQIQAGTAHPVQVEAKTNAEGQAEFQLPMPHLGPGGAELFIQAIAGNQRDAIKYTLRRKA